MASSRRNETKKTVRGVLLFSSSCPRCSAWRRADKQKKKKKKEIITTSSTTHAGTHTGFSRLRKEIKAWKKTRRRQLTRRDLSRCIREEEKGGWSSVVVHRSVGIGEVKR